MKKHFMYAGVLTALISYGNLQAQQKKEAIELDEIVLDSRFKTKKVNSGKVVHKITSEMIKRSQGKSLTDLINQVAGFEINGNTSSPGQNLGLFIRGGRTNEVVILIDGLQVSDPILNGFDLRSLNLNDVESIEIIKGAASTLYGTGAATAVIDIRMKKAVKDKITTSLGLATGTNQTQNTDFEGNVTETNANISGTLDKFNYLVSFSSVDLGGFSAAEDETGNQNFNEDPFRRTNVNTRFGYSVSDAFQVTVFGNLNNFHNSFDTDSFTDGNNFSEDTNYRVGISPKYNYGKGSIQLNAAYSKYNTNRERTSFPGKVEGENYIFDAFIKHTFEQFNFIGGVNFQESEIRTFSIPFGATDIAEDVYSEEPKTTIVDPYANVVYISDFGLNVNAGVRLNNHSRYGNHFVYNFNPSYRFKHENGYTRIFGSYSTAFVAPSVRDLFASFGNVDLEPQESTTYEFGIEYARNNFEVNIVYFNRGVENLITFNPATFSLINSGDVQANGIEFTTSYKITEDFNINANYTYTDNKQAAIRIPKSKANIGLGYTLSEATNFALNYQYVSDRGDTDFRNFLNIQNVTLDSYSLLDFITNHALNDNVRLTFAATNLLNTDYQEVFGFNTKGRNYKFGVQFQF